MTSLYCHKKCLVNFQKILLEGSKTMFWSCLNLSGKQTQMMVVRESILSSVMQKNDKLAYDNVRFQLASQKFMSPIHKLLLFPFAKCQHALVHSCSKKCPSAVQHMANSCTITCCCCIFHLMIHHQASCTCSPLT